MATTWLTVSEVARVYSRTERQVRSAIAGGHLPANRPTGSKSYRVAADAAEALYGVAKIHTPTPKGKRESESARIQRQLAEAGIG